MVNKLITHYLSDLSFEHKKPVKEGHKADDSLSSQDESDTKHDTLDESLLDPKHDRSSLEYTVNHTQKRLVEAKQKIAAAVEKKEDEHVLQGARDELARIIRELAGNFLARVHVFENSESYTANFDFKAFEPLAIFIFACDLA